MKCNEIMNILEELAPTRLAESWDNVGLLVGDSNKEVKNIMIGLDATEVVIKQAIEKNIDLLITHHPAIFKPVKNITNQSCTGRKIMDLIRNDISYYAMHTNFDSAAMANEAAKRLNLLHTKVLDPIPSNDKIGVGCYGFLKETVTLEECAELVKKAFELETVRLIGDSKKQVTLVAMVPGSGDDFLSKAIQVNADVYITGDMDHHAALDALEQGISVIDAGHFGTEHIMVEYVKEYLKQSIEGKSKGNEKVTIYSAIEESPFQLK